MLVLPTQKVKVIRANELTHTAHFYEISLDVVDAEAETLVLVANVLYYPMGDARVRIPRRAPLRDMLYSERWFSALPFSST